MRAIVFLRRSVAFLAAAFSAAVAAQSLPAGVSPQMIQQLQSMPPAQQQALVRQYGITLPNSSASTVEAPSLGQPGQRLEQNLPNDSQWQNEEMEDSELSDEEGTKVRTRFGRDLFNRDVSTFAPTDDAPVPDHYRLGVGDQLLVHLFGKENEQLSLQVGRDGTVTFPRLGVMAISGLTFEDARDLIKTRVAQQLIGVQAIVTMGRLRAIGVFMAGEVRVPGAYSVSALTTVTQALFQAGGVTDIGALRNIQVKRSGQTVARFDAYDLLMRGDASNDIRLQSGDVVFVPPYQGVAELQGEVKRPMVYELAGGETLNDLITMAGGYAQNAFPSLAVLVRTPDDGGLAGAISLNLYDAKTLSLPVADGDILRVSKVGEQLANSVKLTGAVNRPGSYGWFDGMRVSSLIKNVRADLLREADLSYALLVSFKNELLDISVTQFSLVEAITAPGTEKDPLLSEFDEVIVFALPGLEGLEVTNADDTSGEDQLNVKSNALNAMSMEAAQDDGMEESAAVVNSRERLLAPVIEKLRAQARNEEPVQTVSITGAVRAPGTYPLTEGATLQALIEAAGGLKDSAYLQSAEFRRLNSKASGEVDANYEEVSLQAVMAGEANRTLVSRDHLTVRDIPDWNPNDSIKVSGEVAFPGTYLIQRGETLSDVIKRAGGLTPDAFPEAAVFTREEVAKREAEQARAFANDIRQTYASRMLTEETTTNTLADISEITSVLDNFEGRGRLLVDLPLAMTGDPAANIEVADGDTLTIPKRTKTVTVVGEVYQQGTHTFTQDFTLEDYLGLSAGLTARADNSAIYVIKANGSVAALGSSWWRFNGSSQRLSPGDTIVVPVNSRYKESLATWRDVTQIVYQSLISIAAVANL